MPGDTIETTVHRIPRGLTINIVAHFSRRYRARMRLARWLAWLAAYVAGCELRWTDEVEE